MKDFMLFGCVLAAMAVGHLIVSRFDLFGEKIYRDTSEEKRAYCVKVSALDLETARAVAEALEEMQGERPELRYTLSIGQKVAESPEHLSSEEGHIYKRGA